MRSRKRHAATIRINVQPEFLILGLEAGDGEASNPLIDRKVICIYPNLTGECAINQSVERESIEERHGWVLHKSDNRVRQHAIFGLLEG